MPLVRNSMGYTSALPCGDATDDWCSGAEYASWRETAMHYVPGLLELAKNGPPALGVRAGSLVAQFNNFAERGGTFWEYPITALERPTTRQLAQLVQGMFDIFEEAGFAQPLQVRRNDDLPTPNEGLGFLGWGVAIGAAVTVGGYFYLRSLDR